MFRFGSDEISVVARAILDYARSPRWNEQRAQAEAEAFGDPDGWSEAMRAARASMLGEEAFALWFAFERPIDASGSRLVDAFLRDRHDLTTTQRDYVRRVRTSCLRPYEVIGGDDVRGPVALRDLWTDDLVPLASRGARRSRGNGMAFVRMMIGPDGLPEMLEALAVPRPDMKLLLFQLRLMRQQSGRDDSWPNDDDFFKFVTPWILRAWLRTFARPRKEPLGKRIVQVKVTLDGIRPLVWRRLLLPESLPLLSLSAALERAMGWESYHLHEFELDGVAYGEPDSENPRPVHAQRDYRFGDFGLKKGGRFTYRYDFGDDWQHRIVVEKVLPAEPGIAYPVCIDGARACPPEDVGGPHGYSEFVKVLRNPRHRAHEEVKRWSRRKGRDFDPERFDNAAVNTRLRRRVIVP